MSSCMHDDGGMCDSKRCKARLHAAAAQAGTHAMCQTAEGDIEERQDQHQVFITRVPTRNDRMDGAADNGSRSRVNIGTDASKSYRRIRRQAEWVFPTPAGAGKY
eukprot:5697436-Pleurochrysis_carterae.AAC.1